MWRKQQLIAAIRTGGALQRAAAAIEQGSALRNVNWDRHQLGEYLSEGDFD